MITTYKLSFGQIHKIHENFAEVIINEGVELTMDLIQKYHHCLLENFTAPFVILINKKYKYTYTFEAQMNIASLSEIQAMAVVSYSNTTKQATEALIRLPRKIQWNIAVFSDRDAAVDWLLEWPVNEVAS